MFSKICGYAIVIMIIVEKYSKKDLFYGYCLWYDLNSASRGKLLAFHGNILLLAIKKWGLWCNLCGNLPHG